MYWNDKDIDVRLLLAKPIELKTIGTLQPLTIDEISHIGFSIYNQYMSLLCLSSDDIGEMLNLEDNIIIEPFDFIIENCLYGNGDFQNSIMDALFLFFRENIEFHGNYFSIGDISKCQFLKKENYDFFVDMLKRMNCINTDIKKEKPKTEAEKKFWDKMKEARKKYNKSNEETDMSDIISSVCCKHPSLNLLNIGGLTIYQLINNYIRLNTINEYDISISSILHGADSKSVNLKHWSSKLKLN